MTLNERDDGAADASGALISQSPNHLQAGTFLRALLFALAGFLVIAAFAIGSRPDTDGTREAGSPGAVNLVRHLILGASLVLIFFSAAYTIYALWPRKQIEEKPYVRKEISKLPWWLQTLISVLPFLLTAAALYWLMNHRSEQMKNLFAGFGAAQTDQATQTERAQGHERPVSDYWLAIASAIALIALIVAFVAMKVRPRPPEISDVTPFDWDDEADDLLLSELRAEVDIQTDAIANATDPREAVIAAYAAMETILGRHSLPRRTTETPAEYAVRVARTDRVPGAAMDGLTRLFEVARYSEHQIGTDMQQNAVAALITVRDAL
jgi:hypothetical protein